jgi:nucleoside-diphosphate-sugar epimerase
MNHLVTGGAGFIGRWVVRRLLERPGDRVTVIDDYSNSHPRNLAEFERSSALKVVKGSVTERVALEALWSKQGPFDTVYHLAASIRVQDSIDAPRVTYDNDVTGTFEVLEMCRKQYLDANGIPVGAPFHLEEAEPKLQRRAPRLVFMSTCMVYNRSTSPKGIGEDHSASPASPYGAFKIAGEAIALSYHRTYRLPVKVIRPFNTYGPFQKGNLEGGVVAIFIARDLAQRPLLVKGDGKQTRDLLYVEDCADFVVQAGLTEKADGEILNAGLGRDIAIRDLARLVADPANGGKGSPLQHVPHDHPQVEIAKLLCDNTRTERLLGWKPTVSLEEGIRRTREWIREHGEV